MQTIQRNNEGTITHVLLGKNFITKEEYNKRLEVKSDELLTLSELDKMEQTDKNIRLHKDRNNLICDYADILFKTNNAPLLNNKDLMDWRDAIDFRDSLSDSQEINLFEDQYNCQQ